MPEGRIISNDQGDKLILRNGEWVQFTEPGAIDRGLQTASDIVGAFTDAGSSATIAGGISGAGLAGLNLLEALNVPIPEGEFEGARRGVAEDPVGGAIGQGIGAVIGGAGGAKLATSLFPRSAIAADFFGGNLGAFGTTSDRTREGFVGGLGTDARNLALFAAARMSFGAVPRVINAIKGFSKGPSKDRTIELGEGSEFSRQGVEDIQTQGAIITPAQAEGTDAAALFEDSIKSSVIRPKRLFGEAERSVLELMQGKAAKSIGLEDAPLFLDKGTLGGAEKLLGSRFEETLGKVGDMFIPARVPDDIRALIDAEDFIDPKSAASLERYAKRIENIIDSGEPMTPKQFQNLRSKLTAGLADVQGVQGFSTDAETFFKTLDVVDTIPATKIRIEGGDPAAFLDEYGVLREQWKNFLALGKGKALNGDGVILPKTFSNNLEQIYGKPFRLAQHENIRSPDTVDMFKVVDALNTPRMQSTVNSLTASRQSLDKGIDIAADLGGQAVQAGTTGTVNPGQLTEGFIRAGANALSTPLHFARPGSPATLELLRNLGTFGAGAVLSEPGGNEQ